MHRSAWFGFALIASLFTALPAGADSERWYGFVAGGAELSFGTALEGHAWVLFDAQRRDLVKDGDLRLHFNTQKLHVGLERLSIVPHRLEFSIAITGELILAQLLTDYYVQGERDGRAGINASYVDVTPKFQWHFAPHHTFEWTLGVRQWFFSGADAALGVTTPPDFFAFSPRLGYIFWKVNSPATEWQPHRPFARVDGIALGVSAGIDVRTKHAAWNNGPTTSSRNAAKTPIAIGRQWLRAGWQAHPIARLQIEQHGAYGWNEDDITRQRVGGMNPYVLPIPGLPWTAVVSERLLLAQTTLHLRANDRSQHEFGIAVAGAVLNDVFRRGDRGTYGGAGGLGAFADLRFGRWQIDARFGWAFPVAWLARNPHLSAMLAVGVHAF